MIGESRTNDELKVNVLWTHVERFVNGERERREQVNAWLMHCERTVNSRIYMGKQGLYLQPIMSWYKWIRLISFNKITIRWVKFDKSGELYVQLRNKQHVKKLRLLRKFDHVPTKFISRWTF